MTYVLGDSRIPERMWEAVEVNIVGCWEWTNATSPKGYGHVMFQGKCWQAHRAFFTLLSRPIPKGLVIDHLCDNRPCVNPSHMDVVTAQHNGFVGWGQSALMSRLTECKNGHPFDSTDKGGRVCSQCKREYSREQQRIRRQDPNVVELERARGRIYDKKRRERAKAA